MSQPSPSITFYDADTEQQISNPGFTFSYSYGDVTTYNSTYSMTPVGEGIGQWRKVEGSTQTLNKISVTESEGWKAIKYRIYTVNETRYNSEIYLKYFGEESPSDNISTGWSEHTWFDGLSFTNLNWGDLTYLSSAEYDTGYEEYGTFQQDVTQIQIYVKPVTVDVSITVQGEGEVTGAGTYPFGATVSLSATNSNENYEFSYWYNTSNASVQFTDNPITWKIGYSDSAYHTPPIFAEGSTSWVAVFAWVGSSYTIQAQVTAQNYGGGYCLLGRNGDTPSYSTLSDVRPTDTVTVTAAPSTSSRQAVLYIESTSGEKIENPNKTNLSSVSAAVSYTYTPSQDETWTAIINGYVTLRCNVGDSIAYTRVAWKGLTYGEFEALPTPETSTTEGTTFLGWASTEYSSEADVTDTTIVSYGSRISTADIYAIFKYTITIAVSPEGGGTVTGGGEYAERSYATLTATPAAGYIFKQWTSSDFSSVNGSTSTNVTIFVTNSGIVTAVFEQLTVTVIADPTNGGTVSTDKESYSYGELVTLTATPNSGYWLHRWDTSPTATSIYNTRNPYTFYIYNPVTYYAHFRANISVSVVSGDTSSGTVAINGTESGITFAPGNPESYTVSAFPKTGYVFDHWTRSINGGTEETLVTGETFTTTTTDFYYYNNALIDTIRYTAHFTEDSAAPATYTLTYHGNGEDVTGVPAPETDIEEGSSIYISLDTPTWDEYHTFLGWSEDPAATSPDSSLAPGSMLSDISRDYDLYAVWQNNTPTKYTITLIVSPTGAGTVTGGGEYAENDLVTITATASGHQNSFKRWTKNGTEVSTESTYMFVATEDATYTAEFNTLDSWVIYNSNGATWKTEYYESATGWWITSEYPTYTGHIFLGWSTATSASSVQYLPDTAFNDSYVKYPGEHILYAVWVDGSGAISTVEQTVTVDDETQTIDIGTCTATWTIDSYTPGDILATGHIDWTISDITNGYEISKITFYQGSTELGYAYAETGNLSELRWDVTNPPDKVVISWTYTGRDKQFTVTAVDEEGNAISDCTVVIKPADVTSGRYATDEVIWLVATAGTDWQFLYWRLAGGTDNVSTAESYTIVVNEDNAGDYVAYFKNKNEEYDITLSVYPTTAQPYVSVDGAGKYHIGDSITFTASTTSSSMYGFKYWKMRGYDYTNESNPYTWKLSALDVDMSLVWIAVFEAEGLYQVLTLVNVSAGQCERSPVKAGYQPNEELTITASLNTDSSTSEGYACIYLVNSQNERIANSNLSYGSGFATGLTYTYNVTADTVWTANFAKYLTVDFYLDGTTSSIAYKRYAFPGKTYGFNETLPIPAKDGYYFKGWYTEPESTLTQAEDGEKVTEETTVPESSSNISLYAHWVSSDTKYRISAVLYPTQIAVVQDEVTSYVDLGTVEISGNANEGYFLPGETCRIDVTIPNTRPQFLYAWEKTQVSVGYWKDIVSYGVPLEFTVGADSSWETDGEVDGEKKIDLRLCYTNRGVRVATSYVPSSGLYGTVSVLEHVFYPPGSDVTVTATPNSDYNASVVKWEHKDDSNDWGVIGDGNKGINQLDVLVTADKSMTIRVTFGVPAFVTYNLNGGTSTAIPDQSFETNEEFSLSDAEPTRTDGYVFIGWSESDATFAPEYLPSASVTFSQGKMLYAVWYKTPQSINTFRHMTALTEEPYEGERATVTAEVSNIKKTNELGHLTGTLTWTVTMPSGSDSASAASDDSVKFSQIRFFPHADPIYSSSELTNTEGVAINFTTEYSIENEWHAKILYSNDSAHIAYFDANGGLGGPVQMEFEEWTSDNQGFTIPMEQPIREDYAFLGWSYEDKDATIAEYQPGDIFNEPFALMKDITFYAVWTQGTPISIKHYNNTTKKESTTPLSYATAWYTINKSGLLYTYTINWRIANVKDGYELAIAPTIKTYTSSINPMVESNDASGTLQYKTTSDLTEAEWTAEIHYIQNEFTISYDTKGGLPLIPDQIVPRGETVNISGKTPRIDGFMFMGWDYLPDADFAAVQPGLPMTPNEDVMFYAVYEEDSDSDSSDEGDSTSDVGQFTIYAKPDVAGTGSVTPIEKKFEAGDNITFTATPSTGYVFSYWTLYGGNGVPDSTSPTFSVAGTEELDGSTFVAVFTRTETTITSQLIYYKPNGLLMDYKKTLIWDDDGLVGCGDGSSDVE